MGRNTLKPTKVKIEVLKSNFKVQILDKSTEKHTLSKSFYSKKSFDFILNKIISYDECGDKDITVVLTDLNESKSITKHLMIKGDVDSLFKVFMGESFTKDLLENKYRVVVMSSYSITNHKSFTINCVDEMVKVRDKLKIVIDILVEEQKDDCVVFVDDGKTSSHRLMVQRCGNTECYADSKLFFSFKLPNFSSSEIVDLIIKKIKNGGGNLE